MARGRFKPIDCYQKFEMHGGEENPKGRVYGIEFLNANEQIRSADNGEFVLIDDIRGTQQSLRLPPAAE